MEIQEAWKPDGAVDWRPVARGAIVGSGLFAPSNRVHLTHRTNRVFLGGYAETFSGAIHESPASPKVVSSADPAERPAPGRFMSCYPRLRVGMRSRIRIVAQL